MKLTYRPIDEWPGELTADRKPTPFEAGWSATLDLLEREVAFLTHTNTRYAEAEAVVQLALPEGAIRQDGQLAKGRSAPDHPGVILTIDTPDKGPLRFSCDRFAPRFYRETLNGWQSNLRAIALGLEALRKVERYGLGTGAEQYTGFQALPPGVPMPAAKMTAEQAARWLIRQAFGTDDDHLVELVLTLPDYQLNVIRHVAKATHPDNGGDPADFRKLNDARAVLGDHSRSGE